MSYFDDNEDRITGLYVGNRLQRNDHYLLNPKLLAGTSQGIRNLLGINKTMNITILNVSPEAKTTAGGKPYTVLDLAYKNNTYQGKVEGKKLMPFGANASAFKTLENAQPGQSYEISVVKNDKGYNDWVAAVAGGAEASAPQPTGNSYQPRAAGAAPAAGRPNGTFETPDERAKRQVFIVRQSSLGHAISSLSIGSKAPLNPEAVIETAKVYEGYVFGVAATPANETGFDDMDSDVPL